MANLLAKLLFKNSDEKQIIVKNTAWLVIGEILSRLSRLVIIVYAARMLGVAGWGTLSYAFSLSAILTVFSDMGISAIVTREGARNPEKRPLIFGTAVILKICLVAITFFLFITMAPAVSRIPLSDALILTIAILCTSDALRGFGLAIFRAEERMEKEALVNIITQIAISIIGVILVSRNAIPESVAIAYAVGSILTLLITAWLTRKYFTDKSSRFDKRMAKSIISSAWPISIAGTLSVIMVNADTLIVGWFKSVAEVGLYAAAQKPMLFLYAIPGLVSGSFLPALSRYASSDKESFKHILEKGLSAVTLLSLPICTGIIITAPKVTELLFGYGYAGAALSMQILALTIPAVFLNGMLFNAVFASNRNKELIIFTAIGVISNLGLNILFVPIWGIAGASAAAFAAQMINTAFIWRKTKAISDFRLLKNVKKIMISAAIMTAATIVMDRVFVFPVLATIAISAVIYLGVLAAMKENLLEQLKSVVSG